MRYLFFICIFTLFHHSSFGEYQYFKFDSDKLNISEQRYRRYIKPQLKNIKTEYFYLSKKISYESDIVLKLRNAISNLREAYLEYEDSCFNKKGTAKQDLCKTGLNVLIRDLYKSNQLIFDLRNDLISDLKVKHYNYNNYINFSGYLDKIEIIIYEIISHLETNRLISNTSYQSSFQKNRKIPLKLTKIYTLTNLSITELIAKDARPHFEALLYNFIIPVEENMLKSFSPEWFKASLGKLNLAWNTFHVNIEKGDVDISKKNANLVKIMHNRWNSILKLIF